MATTTVEVPSFRTPGGKLIAAAAAIGFIIILVDYLRPYGTISYSYGALAVVISTALMIFASFWIAFGEIPRWLLVLFEVLIVLDILGTGVCAYFLEAYAVLAFMVIASIGWIWHLAGDSPHVSHA